MKMFSLRSLGSIRHGGRQEIGTLGNKSSVRQRSARSSPPRRRRAVPLCQAGTEYRIRRCRVCWPQITLQCKFTAACDGDSILTISQYFMKLLYEATLGTSWLIFGACTFDARRNHNIKTIIACIMPNTHRRRDELFCRVASASAVCT